MDYDCPHHYYMFRGRRLVACDCFCRECHNGTECICTQCSHDVEVHIDPAYFKALEKEDKTKGRVPAHACRDCGTEVFRNGTKGRFPVRCPACKDK